MSSPTFHPFLRLPSELRLLIWEASCFDGNSTTRHALNYIDVSDASNVKCCPADYTETSACLIDTGLWKACAESSAIMRKKLQKRGLLLDGLPVCQNETRWLRAPAHIRTPVITSGRDLFCFKISDWYAGYKSSPFSFYLVRCGSISQAKMHNIAFELDVVGREKHAQVWFMMRNSLRDTALATWGGKVNISIIDHNVRWYRDSNTVNVTYADYDDEYTIVSWENLCYCDENGVGTGAHAFRYNINPRYSEYEHPVLAHHLTVTFYRWLERTVKILVRRDNEVSCPSLQTGRRIYRPDNQQFEVSRVRSTFLPSLSQREGEESDGIEEEKSSHDGYEEEEEEYSDEEEEEEEEEEGDTESEDYTDDEEPGDDEYEEKRNEELESLPVFSFLTQETTRLWYFPYRK